MFDNFKGRNRGSLDLEYNNDPEGADSSAIDDTEFISEFVDGLLDNATAVAQSLQPGTRFKIPTGEVPVDATDLEVEVRARIGRRSLLLCGVEAHEEAEAAPFQVCGAISQKQAEQGQLSTQYYDFTAVV